MDIASQTEFVAKLGQMLPDARVHLFEVLAHNLTVAARAVWSDSALSPEEQVRSLKSINECLHRTTARVWVERLRTRVWRDDEFVDMLAITDKALHPSLQGSVRWALETSIRSVDGAKNRTNKTLIPSEEKNILLDQEAIVLSQLLKEKVVKFVRRHRPSEMMIEFNDGTRIFVNSSLSDLDVSVT